MLHSQQVPGSNKCRCLRLLPTRLAVTSDESSASPEGVAIPEGVPDFSSHGVTLRSVISGYIFLWWEALGDERMAVFKADHKGFTLLTPDVNCTSGEELIRIPREVRVFKALYLRLPELPADTVDPGGKPLWRRVHENLIAAAYAPMQDVSLEDGVYAAPLEQAGKRVEEFKEQPGFLHTLATVEETAPYFEGPALTDDPAKNAELQWAAGHENSTQWLRSMPETGGEPAWVLVLQDEIGMALDLSALHSNAAQARVFFEEWHAPLKISGALFESYYNRLIPLRVDVRDLPSGIPLGASIPDYLYHDKEAWERIKGYFDWKAHADYQKRYSAASHAVKTAVQKTFFPDWMLLLRRAAPYSIHRQLVTEGTQGTLFYADDQGKALPDRAALPLTEARGIIFARVQSGISSDDGTSDALSALFATPEYLSLLRDVVERGGLPGLEMSAWLQEAGACLVKKNQNQAAATLIVSCRKRLGLSGTIAPSTLKDLTIDMTILNRAEYALHTIGELTYADYMGGGKAGLATLADIIPVLDAEGLHQAQKLLAVSEAELAETRALLNRAAEGAGERVRYLQARLEDADRQAKTAGIVSEAHAQKSRNLTKEYKSALLQLESLEQQRGRNLELKIAVSKKIRGNMKALGNAAALAPGPGRSAFVQSASGSLARHSTELAELDRKVGELERQLTDIRQLGELSDEAERQLTTVQAELEQLDIRRARAAGALARSERAWIWSIGQAADGPMVRRAAERMANAERQVAAAASTPAYRWSMFFGQLNIVASGLNICAIMRTGLELADEPGTAGIAPVKYAEALLEAALMIEGAHLFVKNASWYPASLASMKRGLPSLGAGAAATKLALIGWAAGMLGALADAFLGNSKAAARKALGSTLMSFGGRVATFTAMPVFGRIIGAAVAFAGFITYCSASAFADSKFVSYLKRCIWADRIFTHNLPPAYRRKHLVHAKIRLTGSITNAAVRQYWEDEVVELQKAMEPPPPNICMEYDHVTGKIVLVVQASYDSTARRSELAVCIYLTDFAKRVDITSEYRVSDIIDRHYQGNHYFIFQTNRKTLESVPCGVALRSISPHALYTSPSYSIPLYKPVLQVHCTHITTERKKIVSDSFEVFNNKNIYIPREMRTIVSHLTKE